MAHYELALEIRRELVGPQSLPVSNILEQLGKLSIEREDFKQAYGFLQECYAIRKKLLQTSNSNTKRENNQQLQNDSPEITRVSVLLLYLYQKIENELTLKQGPNGERGIKLVEMSFEIKSVFEDEFNDLNGKEKKQVQKMPETPV